MFSSDRNELRQIFFTAWQKYHDHLPIEPLEQQIIDIILQHPEYHVILNDPDRYQDKDFSDHNPFLHLSLHLALREQIQTNRPAGIETIYQTLCQRFQDSLIAEHRMLECLEQTLWEAQRLHSMPDENKYLAGLKNI